VKRFLLSCICLLILFTEVSGQGVRGRVIDQDGTPLSFTTIFIEETGSGSVTNINGTYEIRLEPGKYALNFQHLGFAGLRKQVTVSDQWEEVDVVLQEQAYLLRGAEIKGGKEDPAYKIMRKAIAKSGFHREQVERYSCLVYLKGGGRLVDYPWFMRKVIEEEGIDTSATFVQESITEVIYERPGKYTENVKSIRTSGDDQNTNPMNYINGSFYEERVAGIVSPLSKKAFAYYRFRYISTFEDRGFNINKIEVNPRVKDEEFVSGYLYIVEDLWSIHSVDFVIIPQGITINIEQNFAPIQPDVWMPISHKYDGSGKLFGFEFTFQYLATVSNYEVEINPDLARDFEVLDIKTEKAEIEALEQSKPERNETEEKLLSQEEVSTKELRKLMRQYEKEERKKQEEPAVVSERKVDIDSLAYKKDSLYWAEVRPVPLTQSEIRGYTVQDSLANEEAKKLEGDTLEGKTEFGATDLLLGAWYDLGKENTLQIHNPLTTIRFNTVDGWNGEYRLSYYKRFENKNRLEISPLFRYSVSRDRGFGKLHTQYNYGAGVKRGRIGLSGGSYYSQINQEEPISPFTNTISSLFAQNNFMKVYDRQFIELNWRQNISTKWVGEIGIDYSRRKETFNTTNQAWINVDDKDYRPNSPVNIELPNTSFGQSDAFKIRLAATWMPFAYAYKRDERYYRVRNKPVLNLRYEKAIPELGEAEVDYDFLALEILHNLDVSIFGTLNLRMEGGKFLNTGNMDLIDYAHFKGNGTIFTRMSQLSGYAIMPYYDFSTNDQYLSTYINFEWRRLLLSRIPLLQLGGISEHFNVNHLITPSVRNYTEVGYSVTNIFRLFRIDVTGSFIDGKYEDFRIQLGITSDLISFD